MVGNDWPAVFLCLSVEGDAEEEGSGDGGGRGEVGGAETEIYGVREEKESGLGPQFGGGCPAVGSGVGGGAVPEAVYAIVSDEAQVYALEVGYGTNLPIGIEEREVVGCAEECGGERAAARETIGGRDAVGYHAPIGVAAGL